MKIEGTAKEIAEFINALKTPSMLLVNTQDKSSETKLTENSFGCDFPL